MSKMQAVINDRLNIQTDDYVETDQCEPTNRVLPAHMDGLMEWCGGGSVLGVKARAYYYTDDQDAETVADNGGDWGVIDWDDKLSHIVLLLGDGGELALLKSLNCYGV